MIIVEFRNSHVTNQKLLNAFVLPYKASIGLSIAFGFFEFLNGEGKDLIFFGKICSNMCGEGSIG